MNRTKLVAAAFGALLSVVTVAPSFADTTPAATTAPKPAVRHHRRHHSATSTKPASATSSSTQGAQPKK